LRLLRPCPARQCPRAAAAAALLLLPLRHRALRHPWRSPAAAAASDRPAVLPTWLLAANARRERVRENAIRCVEATSNL
jgi:hypothetical protein